jgi:hypothetical protein
LKYKRRIFLVTNADFPVDDSEESVDDVAARLNELGIELVIM